MKKLHIKTYSRENEAKEDNKTDRKIKVGRRKVKNRRPAWWDEDCEKAIEDRKRALAKYEKHGGMEKWIEFKRCKAKATRTIKSKKRDDFKKFTNNINVHTNLRYVWNKMRIIKNSFNNVNWNKWQKKNRRTEILNTIEKIAPP